MYNWSSYIKQRREKFKSLGLCYNCGKNVPETDKLKCINCLESSRKSNKKWAKAHPEKAAYNKITWQNSNKEKQVASKRKWKNKIKRQVFDFYGGKCQCCLDDIFEFLQIDHIHKDGKKHRNEVGRGMKIYMDLLKNPYIYDVRVLCANCHFAITSYGKCPHEKRKIS
jgi:hypothetical protein